MEKPSGVTMGLTLRTEYWDDPKARAAFKEFVFRIHNLDLSEWESCGYWDHAYTPFSFFDGDTVVANVCIYLLDAVIEGRATHVAQVSGVGTLPEWRRKGLNRQLTDIGLAWAEGRHDGVFLFADDDAIPFYEKCGFERIDEFVETLRRAPARKRPGAIKLDPGNEIDRDRIYAYANRRAPVSDKFGVLNARLVMFHALHTLRDEIHEISELGCLVFCKRIRDRLSIFDIIGSRRPSLEELYPFIASESDRIIEFHFYTDNLGVENTMAEPLPGGNPLVRGEFPISRPVFPFTCRA